MPRFNRPLLHTLLVTPTLLIGSAATFAAEAQADAAAGGGGQEDPNLMDVNPATFIWQIILFIALFAVLAVFVWPRILSALQGREERMRADLLRAEAAGREADETLTRYKAQLAEAQRESRVLIEQARGEAQRAAAEVKADAQREIQQTRERLEVEIRDAKEQAVADIRSHHAQVATQIASKILQREVTPEDQSRLVDDALAQLEPVGATR